MKRKTQAANVTIKSLGKGSGNLPAHSLEKVVREARSKTATHKAKALKVKDTATGAGHISFRKTSAVTKGKRATA